MAAIAASLGTAAHSGRRASHAAALRGALLFRPQCAARSLSSPREYKGGTLKLTRFAQTRCQRGMEGSSPRARTADLADDGRRADVCQFQDGRRLVRHFDHGHHDRDRSDTTSSDGRGAGRSPRVDAE